MLRVRNSAEIGVVSFLLRSCFVPHLSPMYKCTYTSFTCGRRITKIYHIIRRRVCFVFTAWQAANKNICWSGGSTHINKADYQNKPRAAYWPGYGKGEILTSPAELMHAMNFKWNMPPISQPDVDTISQHGVERVWVCSPGNWHTAPDMGNENADFASFLWLASRALDEEPHSLLRQRD